MRKYPFIHYGRVDVDKNRELSEELKVEGFPTVFIYEYGNDKQIGKTKQFPSSVKASDMIPFSHRLIQKAKEQQGLMDYQIMHELTN